MGIIMVKQRTLNKRVANAYDKYRAACADLVAFIADLGPGADIDEHPEVAALRRRAGAYRAQWEATEVQAEDNERQRRSNERRGRSMRDDDPELYDWCREMDEARNDAAEVVR